ncbi:MAG: S-methyl-5'-thioinosine phosphorylase [Gammaproteobacteria bacterium]|nr:S-methyl-5'-thioinosine phosphorylase [Gammaproteobacteria bacterium]MBT8150727.1 S-methyl-5'-thioinosine phosphorylase [Gammaproteobacteria bacterium]NND40153.1 S-methyl-5'-thioinosine phosphorylase [Pseudomonadales bacterium]NNL11303.1 S-methyl-5'-thioinosine phosphorylase [Pseudomonadales bacterium]NNM12175.1 S-methyl-5'-thioinosine phosphorylase [Pseudomonadales bacterium]
MLAIIGGSGWSDTTLFKPQARREFLSRYGNCSAPVQFGHLQRGNRQSDELCYLPRHGAGHRLPPHKINYRANVDALAQAGASSVIALNAVGVCHTRWLPGELVLPDQVIDYSWGREHSFVDALEDFSAHIDFTEPLQSEWRARLLAAAARAGTTLHEGGTYACMQGPRFETAAEVRKLRRDGCDLVGMTLMPEASLCRERGIDYLSICLIVNPAAGVGDASLSLPGIRAALERATEAVRQLLAEALLLPG